MLGESPSPTERQENGFLLRSNFDHMLSDQFVTAVYLAGVQMAFVSFSLSSHNLTCVACEASRSINNYSTPLPTSKPKKHALARAEHAYGSSAYSCLNSHEPVCFG
jgi:methyl coenzyme M reductase subunit C-like uncharacterized protein (methanogenesis marker protein 7)